MLRIHFTDRDLARTHVAPQPDPLWETVLSLHRLRGPEPVFGQWRDWARSRVALPQFRLLCGLVPTRGNFPDFLTPPDTAPDLGDGLEVLRRTPATSLRHDLEYCGRDRALPPWTKALAQGERTVVDLVADAVRGVHDTVVAPKWNHIEADIEADQQLRARAFLAGGVAGLLCSFAPTLTFDGRTLCAAYPAEKDVHLNGRGLRLIPSYFCWGKPVVLSDTDLMPVLVYPVERRHTWLARRPGSLANLLGKTRARVLAAVEHGPVSTSELAQRLGIATSSASEHLTVLRESGLVRCHRQANTTLHSLTPLGAALLD